ncbi:MAG: hypothetical protein Q9M26_07160 [Mariprofundales bacterium]|nr:hypothetical protein [Mariprofundales bacterium]
MSQWEIFPDSVTLRTMANPVTMQHTLTATSNSIPLSRRGDHLGWLNRKQPHTPSSSNHREQWLQMEAILLPGAVQNRLAAFQHAIDSSHGLMAKLVAGENPSAIIDQEPYYQQQLADQFSLAMVSSEDHDQQAIEKLYFLADVDAEVKDNMDDHEVWCKASWLSFHPDDASLRLRFSFGIEGIEDVAADPNREHLAGELCRRLFPESALISDDTTLQAQLAATLDLPAIDFVERIVYFNAPNGGALMHHDVERGHAGVIYAQISGRTFWLALGKPQLIEEIRQFVATQPQAVAQALPTSEQRAALQQLCNHPEQMAQLLNQAEHTLLESVIDHSAEFIHQVANHGYGYLLEPGDALLMPQTDEEACVWHTVFCLDDEPGEGLSFAMRERA